MLTYLEYKKKQTELIKRIVMADEDELNRIADSIGRSDRAYRAMFTKDTEASVKQIYRKKGLVPAIKRYREVTGAGLAESKHEVERIIG